MNETLTTQELEDRMRPGQYSQGGFLGINESLETVIAQDQQTLAKLGISHDEIAGVLERLVKAAFEQRYTQLVDKHIPKQPDFPNLYKPETNPVFSKDNLPATDIGYLVEGFQLFITQYRGFQVCPWDACGDTGSFDFMILNRNTGASFAAPALITHLIRAHHFFEGQEESPYRVDPEKVIQTLEMR